MYKNYAEKFFYQGDPRNGAITGECYVHTGFLSFFLRQKLLEHVCMLVRMTPWKEKN